MKKLVLLIIVTGIVAIIFSCNKEDNSKENEFPEVIELIKGGDYFHAGNLTPTSVNVVNGVANICFFETPIGFTIHLTDAKSQLCLDLFKYVIREKKALKVFALKNSCEITQVNLVEKRSDVNIMTMEDYLKSKPRGGERKKYPSKGEFEFLVNRIKQSSSWNYSGEGCYARAHEVYYDFLVRGYSVSKAFVFGRLCAKNCRANCYATWNWHVAVLASYYERDSILVSKIIDFCASNEPMDTSDWLRACEDRNGRKDAQIGPYGPDSGLYGTVVLDGEIYKYEPISNMVMLDPDFENTNCVLNYFEGVRGCIGRIPNCGRDHWIER